MMFKGVVILLVSIVLLVPAVSAQDEGLIPDVPQQVSWKEFLPRGEQIDNFMGVLRLGAEDSMAKAAVELENASYSDLYNYVGNLSVAILKITEDEGFAEMLGAPEVLGSFNSLVKGMPAFVSAFFLSPQSDEPFQLVFSYMGELFALMPYLPEIIITSMTFLSNLPEIIASVPIYSQNLQEVFLSFIPVLVGSGLPILCVWIPKLLFLEAPKLLDAEVLVSFLLGAFETFGIGPLADARALIFGALPNYGAAILNSGIRFAIGLPRIVLGAIVAVLLDIPVFIIDFVSLAVSGVIGSTLSVIPSMLIGGINLVGLNLALGMAIIAAIRSTATLAFIAEPLLGVIQPLSSLALQLVSPKAILNLIEVLLELL